MAPRYSLDTSALVEPWNRLYPPDVFPAFWVQMAALFSSGSAVMIDQVGIEIAKKDDALQKWVGKNAARAFRPMAAAVQADVTTILTAHPRLIRPGHGDADPFVIALARSSSLVVVTEEKTRSLANPKIPDVCLALGVPYTNVVGMMREQGWRFE